MWQLWIRRLKTNNPNLIGPVELGRPQLIHYGRFRKIIPNLGGRKIVTDLHLATRISPTPKVDVLIVADQFQTIQELWKTCSWSNGSLCL